jgi:hypothetical protein
VLQPEEVSFSQEGSPTAGVRVRAKEEGPEMSAANAKDSPLTWLSEPSCAGRVPVRRFMSSTRSVKSEQLLSDAGIGPVNCRDQYTIRRRR